MFNVFRKPLPKRNNIGSAEKSVFYYTKFQKRGNAYEGIKSKTIIKDFGDAQGMAGCELVR